MAKCIPFPGHNREYVPREETPAGEVPRFDDMFAFNNGIMSYSCWELSDAEIEEIVRSRRIWLGVRNGRDAMRTTFVGSYSNVRRDCAEFGKLWPRPIKKAA